MSAGAPRRVVLVGLRGAGKSAVGALLAERLAWSFVDLDAALEEKTGRSIRSFFEADEVARFRELEAETLAAALEGEPFVIATGGGVVEAAGNRALLEPEFTVWLQAPPEVLAERTAGSGRPSLLDDGAEGGGRGAAQGSREPVELVEARAMLARRWRHYDSCATLAVATERHSLNEVSDVVEHAWRRLSDNDLR